MGSINTSMSVTQFSATETQRSAQATESVTVTSISHISPETTVTIPTQSKQLQPDQLALSEEAKAKSAEAETKEKNEDKKSIDASSLNGVMTPEEATAAEKTKESDLDKEIRELAMEILEISVKIQMLQDKDDKESVKERQALEVDLAIKKGTLEVIMARKLQQAAAGG